MLYKCAFFAVHNDTVIPFVQARVSRFNYFVSDWLFYIHCTLCYAHYTDLHLRFDRSSKRRIHLIITFNLNT
ncbi:hypothetical protein D3C74_329600 [compost metagenome]